MREIHIGADHAAFKEKEKIMQEIKIIFPSIKIIDVGTNSEESVHYPEFAIKVAKAVASSKSVKGILLCGTGIGMSITANKFQSVRASLCHSEYEAKMTRLHNDSNILCMGARVLSVNQMLKIVKTWINTPFEGGRHQARLDYLKELGTKVHE